MGNKEIQIPDIKVRITQSQYRNEKSTTDLIMYTADTVYNRQRIYVNADTIPELVTLIKKNLDRMFPDIPYYPNLLLVVHEVKEISIDNLDEY